MNQILLVAKREFLTQVKNKTFIIMTLLSPLILVGIIGIIAWMMSANSDQKSVAVVDESHEFITALVSGNNEIYNFYGPEDIKGIKDTLADSKTLNALLVIPKIDKNDFSKVENGIELSTRGSIGMGFKESLEGKLSKRIEELKMEQAGISQEALKNIDSKVKIKTFDLKGGSEEKGEYVKFGLAMFLAYVIFMFIMIYGVKVMRSVVEEKNNRVVEIIISSVKPFNLMMGKILGTTMVALTQFIIWILMTFAAFGIITLILSQNLPENTGNLNMEQLNGTVPNWVIQLMNFNEIIGTLNLPFITVFFIIYFLVGYLFYSSIFAAIGSAVDNDTDTQQFTFYPIFPMMIAMYGSMTTLENPDGPVAFWLSMVPLTSPISMVTRLPFGVEWWEVAISLALLIGFMLLMVFFASKIYRVGILMYGKKPSFKEMWKWMRYSN